jgi:16S rRNA (cytosine967-C5)-methyltransferase
VSARVGGAAVAPARRCAFDVVRRVFERGAYADRALHAASRGLDGRDRALAMRLAFGTVQRRGTVDFLIERLSGRPPGQLDPPLRAALRLGLYELAYLSAPARAIVADVVELAKGTGGGRGGPGLVNAVLRRAARERADLLAKLHDDTPLDAAVMHSHPAWLAEMWWQALGAEEARALLAADNEPAESVLRANSLMTSPEALAGELPVPVRRDPILPEALVLAGPFDAHGSPLWRQGLFTPQSRAAMLPARMLAPRRGERVLDLCAAPGAKTTQLAALMAGVGEIVAVERNRRRAQALTRTCQRMGADIVAVTVADAAAPAPPPPGRAAASGAGAYDAVLVDPPCSGLGTLQARPDLRWRMDPDAVRALAAAQAAILRAGADAVRAGGRLVYSTCTISPPENERLIAAFLRERREFVADDLGEELPAYRHPDEPRHLLTLPHRHATAGFFIARLRRAP